MTEIEEISKRSLVSSAVSLNDDSVARDDDDDTNQMPKETENLDRREAQPKQSPLSVHNQNPTEGVSSPPACASADATAAASSDREESLAEEKKAAGNIETSAISSEEACSAGGVSDSLQRDNDDVVKVVETNDDVDLFEVRRLEDRVSELRSTLEHEKRERIASRAKYTAIIESLQQRLQDLDPESYPDSSNLFMKGERTSTESHTLGREISPSDHGVVTQASISPGNAMISPPKGSTGSFHSTQEGGKSEGRESAVDLWAVFMDRLATFLEQNRQQREEGGNSSSIPVLLDRVDSIVNVSTSDFAQLMEVLGFVKRDQCLVLLKHWRELRE